MKITTITVALMICAFSIVRADTLDYWHIFYNKEKIKEGVEFSIPDIVIKTANVKENDSITIKYYSDNLGFDSVMLYCGTGDKKEYLLIMNSSPQIFKFFFSFSVKQLLENKSEQKDSFIVIYFVGIENYNKKRYKRQVLKVKFE